jgi:hypothetical protein
MSNDSFKTAMRELKEEGKANTENTPIIQQEDLQKLYNSMFISPETPYGLANKVQFDIRYYFFRRGQENKENMRKDTFEIIVTMEGKKCVKKKMDELTKNHRHFDESHTSGFMLETGGDRCPVASFEKYLAKLHPDCDRFWNIQLTASHPTAHAGLPGNQ